MTSIAETHTIRILVADDDDQIREILTTFLEKSGFEVDSAESAASAMALMATQSYDIILTDKNMPDEDGNTEAGMRILRYAREHLPSAEAIMITGYATIETAVEAMKMGAFDYIMKPIPLNDLKEKIDRIIEYKNFLHSDNNLQIYRSLHQQILTTIKNSNALPEDEVRSMLRQLGSRIDNLFGLQQEYETIIQTQADALDKIEEYMAILEEAITDDNPYHSVIDKIRIETAKRLGSGTPMPKPRPLSH